MAASAPRGPPISRGTIAKLVLALLTIGGLLYLVSRLPVLHWLALGAVWTRSLGVLGVLVAVTAIFVFTLLLLPLWALIILCGWLWQWWGLPIALGGSTIAALLDFSIAHALGQHAMAQALRSWPRAQRVFALAERGGPATVALMRLAPVIPFAPGNALLGLTRLRLIDMAIGTPLGMLPACVFYCWLGALLPDAQAIERGDAMKQLSERGMSLFVVFIAAHVVVFGIAALIARKTAPAKA